MNRFLQTKLFTYWWTFDENDETPLTEFELGSSLVVLIMLPLLLLLLLLSLSLGLGLKSLWYDSKDGDNDSICVTLSRESRFINEALDALRFLKEIKSSRTGS